MKKLPLLFWIALSLGILFRFVFLSTTPPSLSHDEVAIGYNAYSILKTGRDEFGTSFPILFRSFDDYKLPGLVYATAPSVGIFGLNELGVRFPSALLGVIAVIAVYGISLAFLPPKKAALIMLLFAVAPWPINFSRQAFETSGSVTFFLLGVWSLLLFRKRPKILFISALCFVLSLYFYYSVRLIIPFVLLVFAVIERKYLMKHIVISSASLLLGGLLLFPLLSVMFSPEGLSRVGIVSVVHDPAYADRKEAFAIQAAQTTNPVFRLLYNRRIALGLTILENYTDNLGAKYIFLNGTGKTGLLHAIELPFFYIGIIVLFFLKSRYKWIAVAWLLAAPLPGAFSTDQPNSLRFLPAAPVFSLLSGLGALAALDALKNNALLKRIAIRLFFFLLCFSVILFSYHYFFYMPRLRAIRFAEGQKELASYLAEVSHAYDRVYVTGYFWRPYIFQLFWQAYDPASYQQGGTLGAFGPYVFTAAAWDKEGIRMSDADFDPKTLVTKNDRALFILAEPEYNIHEDKFNAVATMGGRLQKNVFIAATVKP